MDPTQPRARLRGAQPLPESGERVIMPPAGSKFNKPPTPMTGSERGVVKKARAQRKEWEQTPAGQARTTGLDTTRGANLGQIYHIDNYGAKEDKGPRIYDRQLPGMADPTAAPRPPKWEELNDAQRAHSERALKMRGTDIGQMTNDFGAQLDQAHARSQRHGGDETYASRFYETGEPRKRIDESARALGISPTIHAQMNAFTSPNTKFSIHRRDGRTTYPNDEAAVHAVRWAQAGHDPQALTNDRRTTRSGDDKAQGYETNMRKAASAMSQHLEGVAPADWRFGDGTKDAFSGSPKTGPYANSWSDSHPQFTVADVHTGGGGVFPHLGTEKQFTDPAGKVVKQKSGREAALESVPFAHSAVDYANRQAMVQRGMGSIRRSQATQWGEEQIQRGEAGLRGAPSEVVAYRRSGGGTVRDHNQRSLFSADGNGRLSPHPDAKAIDDRSPTARRMGLDF